MKNSSREKAGHHRLFCSDRMSARPLAKLSDVNINTVDVLTLIPAPFHNEHNRRPSFRPRRLVPGSPPREAVCAFERFPGVGGLSLRLAFLDLFPLCIRIGWLDGLSDL